MTYTVKAKLNCNRWLIAIMGTILQICLGTVYAWSFFQKPLIAAYHWSNTAAMWAFSLAICFLGIAAAFGGKLLPKFGPRNLAMIGGFLYGLGYIVGGFSLSMGNIILFYLGYGVIGGIGLGFGYVAPVATVAKWFPDRKGFATGMVVMGFGLGAMLMSKVIAPFLMNYTHGNLPQVFYLIGAALIAAALPAGYFLKAAPADFVPDGWMPSVHTGHALAGVSSEGAMVSDCLISRQFFIMWLIFFCNIAAGIIFIGMQSPMLQDLLKMRGSQLDPQGLAAAGATLIAISSLCNGLGRFFWGGLCDKIGCVATFRVIMGTQIFIFLALIFVKNPLIFSIFVCYILLCYGGGFGSMPSFVLDVFGSRLMPVIYGVILTAWSMGGIVGPLLAACLKDNFGSRAPMYTFILGIVLLYTGFMASFALKNHGFFRKRILQKAGIECQAK